MKKYQRPNSLKDKYTYSKALRILTNSLTRDTNQHARLLKKPKHINEFAFTKLINNAPTSSKLCFSVKYHKDGDQITTSNSVVYKFPYI